MKDVRIFLNGREEKVKNGSSISKFLEARKIRPEVVTVEINDTIIDKESYPNSIIKEKDRVELVFFMGGGMVSCQF